MNPVVGESISWMDRGIYRCMNRSRNWLLMVCALVTSAPPARSAPTTRPAARDPYRNFAMAYRGNAGEGKALFEAPGKIACSQCRTTDGSAGKVGPDLFAIGDKYGRDDLIEQVDVRS
jgi:hypothetical protein